MSGRCGRWYVVCEHWSDADAWFTDRLHAPDPTLDAALEQARHAGLPEIAVSAAQGKVLHLLARMTSARRVLEIGTLGGYSAIWLARALPADGRVVTLEIDPHHAEVARAALDAVGVGERVEIVVGPALDTLPGVTGPFDLVFVDADKENNAGYVRAALEHCRAGAVVVVDNVVRGGRILEPAHAEDPDVAGVRAVVDLVAQDPRLDATVLQTVGTKGWDGFLFALVTAGAG